MREIKFRVWNLKNQFWMDASQFNLNQKPLFQQGFYEEFEFSQFTGLYDKNKTPIYEGDIVDYRYDGMSEYDKEQYADLLVSPVYWDYERWRIKYSAASYAWHLMEVVGNVFENPDLLK